MKIAKTPDNAHVFTRNGVGASRVFCPAGAWPSLLDFLCAQFPRLAPSVWLARMDDGLVLNGQGEVLTEFAPYRPQCHVFYFRHVPIEPLLPYEAQVLYQDDYLVVADKPHFLPVLPSGKYVQETLLVRLKKQLNLPQLSPLHRIDRDTAGLVLFGVRQQDRGAYQVMFSQGQISKQYRAIAPYLLGLQMPHVVQLHLEDSPTFMQVRVNPNLAPNSVTRIVGMERLTAHPEWAIYTLQPLTGRRHQLRVHMMHLGAPLLGDQIYPNLLPERDISQGGLAPLQLLAQTLQFTDPLTGQGRVFTSAQTLQI